MAKVITFANQKGGVAKTTTSYIVAKELVSEGYKVLAIDMDPQYSLTSLFGIVPSYDTLIVSDFLEVVKKASFADVVQNVDGVDILPSSLRMANEELTLTSKNNSANQLARKLRTVRDNYDFIIIDSPPHLSAYMNNALMASDYLVIPVKAEFLSVSSIDLVFNTIFRMIEDYDKEFDIAGILLTMVNPRTNEFAQMKDYLIEKAKEVNTKVFDSTIRNSTACSTSVGLGENVAQNGEAKVGQDYKLFVQELLNTISEEN